MRERIFALDIGTRSVVGIIMEKFENNYRLIDFYIQEHTERSMLDGQIHDIVSVSLVIEEVKNKLEEKHGPLHKVCVAAAGRALKTKRTSVTKDIYQQPIMEKEDILYLELSAVQQAQYDLAVEENYTESAHYYCVGYSVLQYELDNQIIGSLIDQQGHTAKVEIIATFLPKVVVESLISALTRAKLEMEALTLEPIAAINVLIPTSMRRLNVALVDIGAGTSDIAITEEGTITAYGMVPIAGDEITEAISDHYLLDFPQAELVKRNLNTNHNSIFTDILGFEQIIPYEEIVNALKPAVDKLVESISNEILLLNNRPPKAIMLIGGGSLTPELTKHLAAKLNLPINRVAVRGVDAIPLLDKNDILPKGPEFVTPIGIAISAKQNPVNYISIKINDRVVRLFDMKQLTVGDGLLAAGISVEKIYGKPGMAYMVKLNNRDITLPGSYGTPPTLKLNDRAANINDPIKHDDMITVENGNDGKEPTVSIKELLGDITSFPVFFKGQKYPLEPKFTVNNRIVSTGYMIKDHDNIELKQSRTLEDFLININQQDIINQIDTFYLWINQEKKLIPAFDSYFMINGVKARLGQELKPNDSIQIKQVEHVTLRSVLESLNIEHTFSIPITFNNEAVTLTKPRVKVDKNERLVDLEEKISRGDQLQLKELDITPFIFQDIFRFVSVDLSQMKGNISIQKNGQSTAFFDELSPGDSITIEWNNSKLNTFN